MELVSMARTNDERVEMMSDSPRAEIGDEYPYGLRLSLDADQLEKLGVIELDEIGTIFALTAVACVINLSKEDGRGLRVELQIKELALKEDEKADEEEDKKEEGKGMAKGKVSSIMSHYTKV
jgi:hypothetical protein